MSPGRGAPWWYSGDDEPADGALEQGAGPTDEHAASAPVERADALPGAEEADEGFEDPGAGPGATVDWGALLAGASRMVDWATSTVMAPHAQHEDPAQYPQCVVCRTIVLVGDSSGIVPGSPPAGQEAPAESQAGVEPITWIPIVEEIPRPPGGDQA